MAPDPTIAHDLRNRPEKPPMSHPPTQPKGRILVVDDEPNARKALSEILTDEGYAVETASDGFRALGALPTMEPDLVLTDLKMPGLDGLSVLQRVREFDPDTAVVVMTAFGAVDTAVKAMREGAADYLAKPLNTDELLIVIERALERVRLRKETRQLRSQLEGRYRHDNIVGTAPEMQRVFKVIEQVAPTRATVLITGESGTGKELVAAAVHQRSPRKERPFIKLHCAALAESLLESELFGHERGAFTGADRRREGRFEQANGGTLFLDEVGEISPATQVKLLRVLQEHEFERVGGTQTLSVDVRLIAATNRDLKREVEQGRFREDLFYRLNVINLRLPSLRERRSDIPAIATHFLKKYSEENRKHVNRFGDAALARIVRYDWPGNVRELENVIERAVVLVEGDVIEPIHLPAELGGAARVSEDPVIPGTPLAELERHAIMRTLESVGGSTTKAAKILGISVRKIQYKLHEYGEAPKSGVAVLEHDEDSESDPPPELVTH